MVEVCVCVCVWGGGGGVKVTPNLTVYIVYHAMQHCQAVTSDIWNDRFQHRNSDSEESTTTPSYLNESLCESEADDETNSQTAVEEIEGS